MFGTAISCMDGRIQEPIRRYITERFGLEHVDVITQPGIDGVLAGETTGGKSRIELIKCMLSISVNAHGSSTIVISGHYDCAGHPVSDEQHIHDIKKAVSRVKSWDGMSAIQVIGVWVNKDWKVEVVA
ncbi:MAG: hypothetical protein F4Y82_06285 [Cenarchaeum sp. SB0665_bin_23]|nr:hypothetical protein [Cenarchaeum sp. SB0667_bin_13]MXY38124.1 hypothetical protein [Cenarchaeum sp. SB0664_bin_35]MXY61699.1 hypothetical protein [Cenarchaeum sp. SB0665_bin_23]MYB47553.1 hypothetical protein [Cenarchaeum sp. SB0662_bin_33]MYC79821.1 hypothetical protein [Cenarchaeum sp. SB0661_bin_35]MYG32799.1 hypothetical protein [Cenarchaeum sp. SB0677_bin_16]MYI51795.1 hypothetical protein [Cenarchaeum sp. SB0673_bin_9]